mmetsp:Transcript_152032/g.264975  ORF Transcript_152032/g.264975 Transcript_152032/m.264975 type:complete len:211 (+) Transcript_152032:46-678(+)
MYKASLVLVCLTCAGHGRRVKNEGADDAARVLAALLLAPTPDTAFNPSGSASPLAGLRPKATAVRNRPDRHHGDVRMLFGGGDEKKEGGGGGMMDMMKAAQEYMSNPELMKKYSEAGVKVQELQKELAETEIECSTKDGGVVVTISGTSTPMDVKVSDDLCSKSAAEASEELTNAMKNAHLKSTRYAQEQMKALYEGLGLDAGAGGMPGM